MLNIETYNPIRQLPKSDVRVLFKVKGDPDVWYTGVFSDGHLTGGAPCFFNDDYEGYETDGFYRIDRVSEWGYIE